MTIDAIKKLTVAGPTLDKVVELIRASQANTPDGDVADQLLVEFIDTNVKMAALQARGQAIAEATERLRLVLPSPSPNVAADEEDDDGEESWQEYFARILTEHVKANNSRDKARQFQAGKLTWRDARGSTRLLDIEEDLGVEVGTDTAWLPMTLPQMVARLAERYNKQNPHIKIADIDEDAELLDDDGDDDEDVRPMKKAKKVVAPSGNKVAVKTVKKAKR